MPGDALPKLWYLVEGTPIASYITAPITDSVAQLKEAIKVKKQPELDYLSAERLILWKVRTSRSQS
jgi:hypothetical protein